MLTEDYLMRQIRLFVAALTKALGLKTMQLHQDAIWVLDQALEQLFGLPLDVVNRMDDNSLIAAVRAQDKDDLSRLRMAAELYEEESGLYGGLQEPGESIWRLVRALNLYLEVELSGGASGFTPAEEKLIPLVDRLGFERIPPDLLYPLFGWAEQSAQTQLAINTLIRLLKAYPNQPELKEDGRAFLEEIRQNGSLADPVNKCLNVERLEELLAA